MARTVATGTGYERLEVYQRAMELVPRIRTLIGKLPDIEKYEMASQLRRASRSIPANIAEGYAKRRSSKEFCAYLTTALGSANEMEVHLRIAADSGYGDEGECAGLVDGYKVLGRQLNRLIASWRQGVPVTINQQRATEA